MKRGRSRKAGARERNGQPQRALGEKIANERFATWQRRHLNGLIARDLMLDPRVGDPLGLLYVGDYIDEPTYQSGLSYRDTARSYRRINGLPSGLPKLLGVKGISHYEADPKVATAIKVRYLAYRLAIKRAAGSSGLAAVHRLCSTERMIEADDLDKLKLGLAALAAKKGQGSAPKRLTA